MFTGGQSFASRLRFLGFRGIAACSRYVAICAYLLLTLGDPLRRQNYAGLIEQSCRSAPVGLRRVGFLINAYVGLWVKWLSQVVSRDLTGFRRIHYLEGGRR